MTSVWGGPEQEPAGVGVGWPRAGAGGSLCGVAQSRSRQESVWGGPEQEPAGVWVQGGTRCGH